MYCTQCGAKAEDGAKFCTACGAPLTDTPAPAEQPIYIDIVNHYEYRNTPYSYKNKWVAFILCLLFGIFGFHRMYVGKIGTGILWLFTGGLLGIGWLVDLVLILIGQFRDHAGYPLG